jgi:uncharacterized protein YtpQ (UPF0354 family)
MIKQQFVDKDGFLTDAAKNLMEQLLQNMQQNLSDEGLVVPGQDSANVTIIQNGVNEQGAQIALKGTLIFDTSVVNGGSGPAPNGQLKILLNDGTFHAIVNL